MEFVPWLLRAILITVIIRFVLRLIAVMRAPGSRPSSGPGRPRPGPPRTAERAGGTLVRDPQCGTYVAESRAIRVGSGANAQYFCSDDCRRAYLAAHPTAHSA